MDKDLTSAIRKKEKKKIMNYQLKIRACYTKKN